MSATLQIIAVMKTLGAVTLKDHSIASVNKATIYMEMDTIVQVKSYACVWLTYPLLSFKKTVNRQSFFLLENEKKRYGGGGHVRRLNMSIM